MKNRDFNSLMLIKYLVALYKVSVHRTDLSAITQPLRSIPGCALARHPIDLRPIDSKSCQESNISHKD